MFDAIKNLFGGGKAPAIEASSILGRKPAQEDSYLATEPRHGMRLVFVADGVGGHGHGDWASQAVVEVFRGAFSSIEADADIPQFLRQTAMQVARTVLQKSIEAPEFKNCGTTVSGFMIKGDSYYTINIGDSRVYLWCDSMLCRETHDQSIVQELLDRGEITEDEAFTHPKRNIMTSAIGQSLDLMRVDINGPRTINGGEILMACTDGVHDALMDNQILMLMNAHHGDEGLAGIITSASYNAGGRDNITAVIYRHPGA